MKGSDEFSSKRALRAMSDENLIGDIDKDEKKKARN